MTAPLLEIKNLCKHFVAESDFFGRPKAVVKAVDGVSLTIERGETLGLVGESGCGKSTLGRTVIGLYPPTSGEVWLEGEQLRPGAHAEKKIQMIFQDPYACLNPRMTVGEIIGEPLEIHGLGGTTEERRQSVRELLQLVGLSPEQAGRFPHEFSGGQRQRIGIARALAMQPELIICDEPIAALDVSIQAQVVNLLGRLQRELGLAYLFIAHDLAMVRYISHRIAVMYLGRLVELAPADELYQQPCHPYTRALLSAVPTVEKAHRRQRIRLEGELPSPLNPPPGCPFSSRCPYVQAVCRQEMPVLKKNGSHYVACHLVSEGKFCGEA